MAPTGPPAGVVPVSSSGGLGDLFSLSGGAGLTSGYVSSKVVSALEYVDELIVGDIFKFNVFQMIMCILQDYVVFKSRDATSFSRA